MLVAVRDLITQVPLPTFTVVPSTKPVPVKVKRTPAVDPELGEMLESLGGMLTMLLIAESKTA